VGKGAMLGIHAWAKSPARDIRAFTPVCAGYAHTATVRQAILPTLQALHRIQDTRG
jgi:hypothetical protein